MRETGGLCGTAQATRIRSARGTLSMTDGPFTETKEVVGGYAIFDVDSREEVVEWTRRFMELHAIHWPEWEGESEIRQLMDQM